MRTTALAVALTVLLIAPVAARAGTEPVATRFVAVAGVAYSGPVGGVSADAYDPLRATIDWGDGTPIDDGETSCIACSDGLALQSIAGTHTFVTAGRYLVVVTVLDPLAGTRLLVRSTALVRGHVLPPARIVGPTHAVPGTRVSWRVPVTLPANARRLYTFWRLGSGRGLHPVTGGRFVSGMAVTTGDKVTGTVRGRGREKLSVVVADDLGDSIHLSLNVLLQGAVAHAPPRAGFRFYDFPNAGDPVDLWGDFSDPGLPDAPLTYHWEFGDGTVGSSGSNPKASHAYTFGGSYTVRLTVSNANGSDTITDTVTVVGKKICDSVSLNGVRAFFSGCLNPFLTDAAGNLSYMMSSSSPITINGIFFRPLAPQYPIVLKPATGTVWSTVTLERPLCPANKKCDFIGASGGFTVPRPDGNGESIVSEGINASLFGKIAGFALAGTATVHLYADYQRPALYEANVILPSPFVGTGAVKAGASLADFTVNAPNASFGPLQITGLVLTRSAGVTSATGSMALYDGPTVATSFAFSPSGSLTAATADAAFDPGVPLGPLVQLDAFHAAYGSSPFHFVGAGTFGTTARLFGVPVVEATGCLLFGIINPGQSLNDCAVTGAAPFTAAPAVVMRISGSVSLLGKIPLGSGFVDVSTANGLWFGGSVDYGFPPVVPIVSIAGSVSGHIADPSKWQVKAGIEGCIKHVTCTGVDALISTTGIVACASFWWGDPGGYYRWTGSWGLMLRGCDVDSTGGVAIAQASRRRVLTQDPTTATVHLTGGKRFEVIAVAGSGTSPVVTLTGPNGERVVDDGKPFQQHGRVAAIFHLDDDGTPPSTDGSYVPNTTYLYVIRPRAGSWRVRTMPGSSPITAVRTAGSLAAVKVRARVRHLGGRRFALDYDAASIRGQRVTFLEVGRRPLVHVLGTTDRDHGTIRFTAALGPAGLRTIEAQVEQDGLPRAVVRPARYRSPLSTLARPLVVVRATGTTLRVRWLPVRGATSYLVDVRLRDGRHLRLTVRAGSNSISVERFVRTDTARVTVAAVGSGITGPTRAARVGARARPAPIVL